MALARGAALASANAPLFASSTAALAYALDPGTGEVNPNVFAPAYLDVSANAQLGNSSLAYSAVADEEATTAPALTGRSSWRVVGLAAVFLIGFVALAIALVARCRADGRPANQPTRKRRPHDAGAGAAERARTR